MSKYQQTEACPLCRSITGHRIQKKNKLGGSWSVFVCKNPHCPIAGKEICPSWVDFAKLEVDALRAENERLKNVIDVLELEAKCYRKDRNNFFTVNQQLRWVLRELAYCTSYCSEEDAAYIIETVEEALKEGE